MPAATATALSVGAAAAQGGNALARRHALEARHHRDFAALRWPLSSRWPARLRCGPSHARRRCSIGTCQPSQERAFTPMALRVMARRPLVTCSPAATTTSYSRWSGMGWQTSPLDALHRRLGRVIGPGHQLVGFPRHGGDHHRDLVAALHLALDQPGDMADARQCRPPKCRRISSRSSP